jgi:hypothetical protein
MQDADSITNSLLKSKIVANGLRSVDNVHSDDACDALQKFISTIAQDQWLPEVGVTKDLGTHTKDRNRYRLNWQADSIIEDLHCSYESVTPVINQLFTKTKDKVFIGLNVWKDTEGFRTGMHRDNDIIAVAMQVYQGKHVPSDCGTRFELENEMLHLPYQHNSGYVLEQPDNIVDRLVHGTSKPTPAGCERLSIYAIWSYPQFKD